MTAEDQEGQGQLQEKLENTRDVWRGLQNISEGTGAGRDQASGNKAWADDPNLLFNRFDLKSESEPLIPSEMPRDESP